MYRFDKYYKYIIIIGIYLFSLKLQKWFSREQWEMFCAVINMNEYWNASPLRPKSGSNTLLHCVFSSAVYSLLRPKSLCLWGDCKDGDSWRI